jgi:hypothetical protein
MRALSVVLGIVTLSINAVAEPLSSADREALLGKIDELRDAVMAKVDARFRVAIDAYRAAMLDEGAALEFYLKCVEKVNFEDQGKKASEFREWKKREDDRNSETSMRRALMHQLRWLVLGLRASSKDPDLGQLAREGQDAINDLFRDQATLAAQRQILGQGVTSTVFAKAYGIDGVKLEKWPNSPLDIASFYEEMVFPRYRLTGDYVNLRAAWLKRIQLEGELRTTAPARPRINGRTLDIETEPASRAQERFSAEILPDLQWQMEMDLFRAGDQRGAATRMLAHLEKHVQHDKNKTWSDQLKALLSAPAQAPAATPAGPAQTTVTRP